MIKQSELRLSAQRALIGRIHPAMRLVKIKAVGSEISLSVILDSAPTVTVREDVSIAAAEIVADFPQATKIVELIEVTKKSIVPEHILDEGWVFRRAGD